MKVDNAGTHTYTPPYRLSPTYIHIVGSDPAHILYGNHDTSDKVRDLETNY